MALTPQSTPRKQSLLGLLQAFLTNIALVLASLTVTLLLAEWAVRTWMPCPDYGVGKRPALRNGLFMYDAQLGWKGTPNAQSPYISKDFIIHVTHDNWGYRNQSPPFVAGKKIFCYSAILMAGVGALKITKPLLQFLIKKILLRISTT